MTRLQVTIAAYAVSKISISDIKIIVLIFMVAYSVSEASLY